MRAAQKRKSDTRAHRDIRARPSHRSGRGACTHKVRLGCALRPPRLPPPPPQVSAASRPRAPGAARTPAIVVAHAPGTDAAARRRPHRPRTANAAAMGAANGQGTRIRSVRGVQSTLGWWLAVGGGGPSGLLALCGASVGRVRACNWRSEAARTGSASAMPVTMRGPCPMATNQRLEEAVTFYALRTRKYHSNGGTVSK